MRNIRKRIQWLCALALMLSAALRAQETGSGIAYADPNVRFTVISDGMIRMEYAPDGQFVDEPSFIAVNRTYPQTDFRVKKGKKKVEIITRKMKLSYRTGSGRFTAENLSIASTDKAFPFVWKPGMKQKANLKGTHRTLDGMDGNVQTQTWVRDSQKGDTLTLEDGLLAKDGWTFIDDSEGLLFDNDPEWSWVKPRPDNGGQDYYFMAYGHRYKEALKDFTLLAGKMPLLPRYAFGYWWSRYWAYSDKEMRELTENFRNYGIPVDVMVIDMDWHYTEEGKGGWTGWTWNKYLFPNPQKLMSHLKENGLKVTLNLHPADGVAPYEEKYADLARELNRQDGKTIPWVSSDKRFIQSMFKHILTPMEQEGVDFWWLDWQQDIYDPQVKGLTNTWWLNYVFFSQMEKFGKQRPLLYHRWGGMGNHRYQAGFSGDAVVSWNSLAYQPYFNATASNVLYGYWSHDIGGHLGDRIDPEMYVRWMQFGAFSPIMRTHSQKGAAMNKEPWVFSHEYADILRQTIRTRYRLAPYIYTMARKGYDEGLSLCRPLYYDWPEREEAYAFRNEYMFGDDILVCPATTPAGDDGYATVRLWLPEGEWYEWHTGCLLKGGQTLERRFALDEYPVYVKAGAVLPLYTDEVMNLDNCNERVMLTLFPGQTTTEGFTLYEDNGNDKNYAREYATTRLTAVRDGATDRITIGRREGSYPGMAAERQYGVKVLSALAPKAVSVNGRPAGFEYLGNELAVSIELPALANGEEVNIRIDYPEAKADLDGLSGAARRVGQAIEGLKLRDAGICLKEDLGCMGSLAEAATYAPEEVPTLAARFMERYNNLPEVLKAQGLKDEDIRWFLNRIDWKAPAEGAGQAD